MNAPGHPPLPSILLAYGFRPFFLSAAICSIVSMVAWLLVLDGQWQGATFLTPSICHAHEMLFGVVAASAAGFLLTASPLWSKKPALTGRPLLLLWLAWLLGRLAIIAAPWLPAGWVAALDLLFPLALIVATGPNLWNTGKPVQRIFPVLLGILAMGDGLIHGEAMGLGVDTARLGLYLGVNAIIFFLVMVGGHIMPMFTRAALAEQENWPPWPIIPALEIAGAVTMAGVMLADLLWLGEAMAAPFLLAAGVVQGIRLSRWHSLQTRALPLLWVLHLGYGWLVGGLLVRGVAQLTGWIAPSTAFHALTVGAMGLFTLGIMSRVALAHTGRAQVATRPLAAAFSLVAVAVVLRVFGVAFWPFASLIGSGMLWVVAFALFLIIFWPILTRPRPDGQAG
ncbi:MAG: NnrS family protein [Magnetococcales bacterium]|nr:NnrS family protein [Magnetococcales bacterium]